VSSKFPALASTERMLGPLIWLQAIVRAVEIVAALPNDRKFNPALSLTKTVAVPLALACYPAKLFTAQL